MTLIEKIQKENWYKITGCSKNHIKTFIDKEKWALPEDYQTFLLWSNGGEGDINGNYIALWKIEDLIQLNADYKIQKYLGDNHLVFGTNGGGICYGFDFNVERKIFQSSLGDLNPNEKKYLASDFTEFLTKALSQDLEN